MARGRPKKGHEKKKSLDDFIENQEVEELEEEENFEEEEENLDEELDFEKHKSYDSEFYSNDDEL